MFKCFKRKRVSQVSQLERFRKEIDTDAHLIPLEKLCDRFGTNIETGLTSNQAKILLKQNGPNSLSPPQKESECIKFLKKLTQGFSLLLWIGSILSIVSYFIEKNITKSDSADNLYLGISLALVVLITGIFSYYQESKSSKVMESFKNMIPPHALVIRDGTQQSILSSEVVVGDIVIIKSGDRIPADIRLIENQGLKIDNSSLTGETEALSRGTEPTSDIPIETKNLVFFSTFAVEGTAKGIVIGCGDNTIMGHIAGLASSLTPEKTPIAREISRFMGIISCWACSLGFIFFCTTMLLGYTWIKSIIFLIGIIVANVPEGLLTTVTVCLTLTAKRMAKKNCLVKNLEAVETLGSTTVICSDKTGTLTQNRMTVRHLWYMDKVVEVDITERQVIARKTYLKDPGFKFLARCAMLCNRSEFLPDQENINVLRRKVAGDASEAAILKFMEITFKNINRIKQASPKIVEIPFNSTEKYQVSIHKVSTTEDFSYLLVMKGAPEKILERCSTIYVNHKIVELNKAHKVAVESACEEFGSRVTKRDDVRVYVWN